jgi:iron complex transport system permease protein
MLSSFVFVGVLPGWLASDMFLPLGCVVGAAGALVLLQALVRRSRDIIVLLLVGFLLNSLFLSISSLVTSLAQESWELGRAIVAFSLGDIAGSGFRHVWMLAPLCLVGTFASVLWAKPLDLLLSGEEEASTLGLDVNLVRHWCIAWTAILTAGAVAAGGGVSFVGLVVPHALRPLVGVAHARLLPAAALGGGAFVVACDMLARSLPARGEIPLGVITGLIGAPLFLVLLLKHQRELLRE